MQVSCKKMLLIAVVLYLSLTLVLQNVTGYLFSKKSQLLTLQLFVAYF